MSVTEPEIITYEIPVSSIDVVFDNARQASIGGKSHVRDKDSRHVSLRADQLSGQICHYVVSMHLFGSDEPYLLSRQKANASPFEGDQGQDFLYSNIDVKGGFMRGSNNPLDYRLPVRPQERHSDWVYILALSELFDRRDTLARVHIVGWADSDMLPESPESKGIFAGAHIVQARNLNPIMPFRWRNTSCQTTKH